jgi:hypothetical protein
MARWKLVDGVAVDFTPEEEAARDAKEQAHADTAPARALEELRKRRNNLLAKTDFYALSDVTMPEDMTNYRQQLRDLPSGLNLTTVDDVETVVFPTKP